MVHIAHLMFHAACFLLVLIGFPLLFVVAFGKLSVVHQRAYDRVKKDGDTFQWFEIEKTQRSGYRTAEQSIQKGKVGLCHVVVGPWRGDVKDLCGGGATDLKGSRREVVTFQEGGAVPDC